MITTVGRVTSPGRRTDEQNQLFQRLYEEIRALPGCEGVIVARCYDEADDLTKTIAVFRWRDDAAQQAATPRVGEIAEQMGKAVPGLTAVSGEQYAVAVEL